MKYLVAVKPGSKTESISFSNNTIHVKLRARPVNGQANEALIENLAKHLRLKKSEIKLLKGKTSSTKIVDIPLEKYKLCQILEKENTQTTNEEKNY